MTAAPAPAGRASAPNAAEQAPARTTGALLAIASPLLAIALALAAGALFILAIGERPLEIYALMARESFGTGYGIGQTLFRATPLVFTGLAVALGFRAGLFNIGVEGQLYLGGLAAAVAGAALGAWPAVLLLPAAIARRRARGGAVGRDPRRAEGAHRRARGHQLDHAQLHRVRARSPTSAARSTSRPRCARRRSPPAR